MKKIVSTFVLSIITVTLSLASGNFISLEIQSNIIDCEILKEGCEKDCKKKCCADKNATATNKKTCSKKGKKCCKSGLKATTEAKAELIDAEEVKAELIEVSETQPTKKSTCCKKGKKKCSKTTAKTKPAVQPEPAN